MIDRVYRTVQALINKENRGYLTPQEFNHFAQMAQNEIVEQYFSDYSFYENAKKAGKGNSEHGDLAKHFQEKINRFSKFAMFANKAEEDLAEGEVNPIINGVLVVPDDLYRLTQVTTNNVPVEEEHHQMNTYAQLSPLARSNASRPTYLRARNTDGNDSIQITPTSIETLRLDYIAKPSVPKWTYLMLTANSGQPVFNSAASDYQDFQVHPGDETEITIKILGYTGISIRDPEVIQSAQAEMAQDYSKESKI